MAEFITNIGLIIPVLTNALSIFLEPPIIFFVGAAGVVTLIGLAKKLIPMKKA
jgi:hypothetical protein